MFEQLSLFDTMDAPNTVIGFKPGDYVDKPGRRLTFDEVAKRVGHLIVYDQSTENHSWYKVVLVERVFFNEDAGERRLVYYDGEKQRGLVNESFFNRTRTYMGSAAYELPEHTTEVRYD